ncbi:MAG: hypothetical protein ABL921_09890 [Pirellula sp.]
MKNSLFLSAMALLLAGAGRLIADDAQIKSDLVRAIGQLAERDVFLSGSIVEENPQAPVGLPNPAMMVGRAMSGSAAKTYTGDVEILRTPTDEVVVVSKDVLPSIKAYRQGDKNLCVQSHTDEPFHVSGTMDQLSKLLAWKELAQAVNEASRIRSTPNGQNTSIRVVLNNNYIPAKSSTMQVPAGGGNVRVQVQGGPPQPSVIDISATFVLNGAKEITDVEFSLQYDDPMQAMLAKAMKGGAFAAGGGVIRIGGAAPAGDSKDGDDVFGKLCTFSFKMAKAPLEKAKDFSEQARTLLKGK